MKKKLKQKKGKQNMMLYDNCLDRLSHGTTTIHRLISETFLLFTLISIQLFCINIIYVTKIYGAHVHHE